MNEVFPSWDVFYFIATHERKLKISNPNGNDFNSYH